MFSHLKRRIGVLTAVAVLAALVPTLAVSTASAAPLTTAAAGSDPALYVACPSGSAAAAGFTDTTSTDVDCIAHFGITTGVTATTYEPSSSIPRWQMALYLTRMLNKASFTLGSGADQGFTDISGESAAIQTAINQLMQAGVTTGVTATTFAPADNVSREQMAMFMNRALNLITAGVGGQSDTANSTKVNGAGTGYNYTDIDSGSVTFEGHNSIVEMYSLQIPGHAKTITTFGPSVDISRAEMATWITNALAHTNARPEGLWVQTSDESATPGFGDLNNDLHITNRDASHVPIAGTLVDVFADKTAASTDPFAASGACVKGFTVELGNTSTECAVDIGDVSTNAIGNLLVTVNGTAAEATNGTTWTYWAHTGAVGTAYDNDSPSNSVAISSSTSATVTTCTDSTSAYAALDSDDGGDLVPYGTTVTITCQLEVSTATGTDVAMALSKVIFTDTTQENTDDGAGVDGDAGAENATSSLVTTTSYTDATGAVTYSFTATDPLATDKLQRTEHTVVVTPAIGGTTTFNTQFDDNPALATGTTLTEGSSYGLGVAVTGVSRTHTATVRDQYGNGVASQTATFTSVSETGTTAVTEAFTQSVTRVTDSSGVAILGYTDVQTLTAKVVTTATVAGAGTGTSTFYRIDALTPEPDFIEVDNTATDGAAVATDFATAATTGVATFNAAHGLVTGDEVRVTTQPESAAIGGDITNLAADGANWLTAADATGSLAVNDRIMFTTLCADCTVAVADTAYYVTAVTAAYVNVSLTRGGSTIDSGVNSSGAGVMVKLVMPEGDYFFTRIDDLTGTFHATRSVSSLGAVSYSTKLSDSVASATNGIAKADFGIVHANDRFMEIVINDAANDKLIVENQISATNFDYHAYIYDSGDQFNIYGDTVTAADTGATANQTASSMALFETHAAAKMNAVTGVANAGFHGDIKSILYLNDALLGGVSVFNLGS